MREIPFVKVWSLGVHVGQSCQQTFYELHCTTADLPPGSDGSLKDRRFTSLAFRQETLDHLAVTTLYSNPLNS